MLEVTPNIIPDKDDEGTIRQLSESLLPPPRPLRTKVDFFSQYLIYNNNYRSQQM